jgi:hypothetical protein
MLPFFWKQSVLTGTSFEILSIPYLLDPVGAADTTLKIPTNESTNDKLQMNDIIQIESFFAVFIHRLAGGLTDNRNAGLFFFFFQFDRER